MKNSTTRRQRPLFHDGPDWQQLDETLRLQLVQRLADLFQNIVSEPSSHPPLCDQEQPT